MNRINHLQEQIAQVREFVSQDEQRYKDSPEVGKFFLKSSQERLADLEHELLLAQAERDKEVFELRLIGNQVQRGPIPLALLAKLSDPLNRLVAGTAYKLRHNKDPHGIPEEWQSSLDLRLAAVAPGSSRLILTGNTSPDLAGDSPLQDALNAIFEILQSGPDKFFDHLHEIGASAGKNLAGLLEVFERSHLSCELSWTDPSEKTHKWEGRLDEITKLRVLLEGAGEPETSIESVTGIVTLLAATGRLELDTADGEKVKITFDKKRPELVAEYTLGKQITLTVERTTYVDPVKDIPISRYRLIEYEA